MSINIKDRKELTTREVKDVLELLISVWPPQNGTPDIENMIKGYKSENQNSFHKVLLNYNNEELVGHTEIFNRDIIIDSERIQILALAGVCVKLSFRGKNIGLELVKKSFEFVDSGNFNFSIFQTNMPDFYKKLNCKQINNIFINSKNTDNVNMNPWRNPYVMIYPDTYEIGNKAIDLNGDCY